VKVLGEEIDNGDLYLVKLAPDGKFA